MKNAAVAAALLGWLVVASMVTMQFAPTRPHAEQTSDDRDEPFVETEQNEETAVARLELDLDRSQHEIADLRLALKRAEDHAARYKTGLERAVAELNQMARERASTARAQSRASHRSTKARSSSPRRSEPLAAGPIVVRSTPVLRVLGDQVFATGEIVNTSRHDLAGWLTVELLRNDKRIDVQRRLVKLPVGARWPYNERFLITGFATGEFSARAWLDG